MAAAHAKTFSRYCPLITVISNATATVGGWVGTVSTSARAHGHYSVAGAPTFHDVWSTSTIRSRKSIVQRTPPNSRATIRSSRHSATRSMAVAQRASTSRVLAMVNAEPTSPRHLARQFHKPPIAIATMVGVVAPVTHRVQLDSAAPFVPIAVAVWPEAENRVASASSQRVIPHNHPMWCAIFPYAPKAASRAPIRRDRIVRDAA